MSTLQKLLAIPLSVGLFPRAVFRPSPHQRQACANPLGVANRLESSFSVLSWNIQYGASRKFHFFYDKGPDVHVEGTTIDHTMQEISQFLHQHPADIVALQEVDRNAKRSAYRDQLRHIRDRFPHFSVAHATYFRSPFVPIPIRNPLGKVHTDLCTLSSARTLSATRHQLALLKESSFRQAFNLKRAILETEYQTPKGRLFVANTHLSAFSFNDGTLNKQVQQLEAWIQARPPNSHWIVMGDFNLLPVGDDPDRLLTPNHYTPKEENPLQQLIPKYNHVFPDHVQYRTYLPFGHERPDRKIDYILHAKSLVLESSTVFSHVRSSDHLPIFARFRIR